jgi:hypothetical protein
MQLPASLREAYEELERQGLFERNLRLNHR